MNLPRMIIIWTLILVIAGALAFFLYSDFDFSEFEVPNPTEWMREQLPDALPELETSFVPDIDFELAWERISDLFLDIVEAVEIEAVEEEDYP